MTLGRKQRYFGLSARDEKLDPALLTIERLVRENLESQFLGIKLNSGVLIANWNAGDAYTPNHFHPPCKPSVACATGVVQSVKGCYSNGRYSMVSINDYVIDVLMRDLVAHDRRPVSFLVYLWLAKEQQRRNQPVQVSYRELAESVGVSKSSVQAAVSWLARRKLLVVRKENSTATPRYAVLRPWGGRTQQSRSGATAAL